MKQPTRTRAGFTGQNCALSLLHLVLCIFYNVNDVPYLPLGRGAGVGRFGPHLRLVPG